jgi:class 3 adenylate cyclase
VLSFRRLAWGICFLTLAVVAAASLLVVLNWESIRSLYEADAIEIVVPLSWAVLGGLVASRQPRNAMGWLFLAIALANAIPGATIQYARYAVVTAPEAPFSPWIPWFGYVCGALVYPAGLAPIAMLFLPNGQLLSPRWRVVTWAGVALTAGLVAVAVLDPELVTVPGLPDVPSPTGVAALAGINAGAVGSIGYLVGLVVVGAAGASVLIRLRRSRGDERLQLRWVAYTAAFAVTMNIVYPIVALLLLPVETVIAWSPIVVILGFGVALPAGVAVAILRYRLYDLDLLLNRTILYGAVTVVLLAALGVANVLAQRAVESLFDQHFDLVAAALGLGAGLAFAPVRRWLRPIVDRALPARSRLTLLFTDIVESTQAIVDLGDERWRDVLSRYRAVVRRDLADHRGREVNTAGDAFFAVFDRPIRGVECATAMRDAVKDLGLRVRTGLHCGEVEMRGEQVTGLAVHAAARVMSQAGEDQIFVSSDLAEALGGSVPLRELGKRELRGVPGEWRLFEVIATPEFAGTLESGGTGLRFG